MAQARTSVELLTQYALYHRDQRNIVTHFVGIPMIVFGIAVLAARVQWTWAGLSISLAWVICAATALWYLTRRGPALLHLCVALGVTAITGAAHWFADVSLSAWLASGLGSFVIGWVIQFIGHYYEGKKPAFVDDLVGLLVGPMFLVAEVMFALGWNKPLHAEIERRAGPTHLRDLMHAS